MFNFKTDLYVSTLIFRLSKIVPTAISHRYLTRDTFNFVFHLKRRRNGGTLFSSDKRREGGGKNAARPSKKLDIILVPNMRANQILHSFISLTIKRRKKRASISILSSIKNNACRSFFCFSSFFFFFIAQFHFIVRRRHLKLL